MPIWYTHNIKNIGEEVCILIFGLTNLYIQKMQILILKKFKLNNNMKKLKVLTVVGTRPEIIRLSQSYIKIR